jgi:ubiquinone/menaquinone biosynthesis C-methylase UbiE
MVRKLRRRVAPFGSRVEIIQGDAASITTESDIADICLLYYSFHEIAGQQEAVERIAKMLRGGGKAAIYEPAIEVSEADMARSIQLFETAGFSRIAARQGRFTRFALMQKRIAPEV